jgi:hypothetical protein
MANPVAIGAEHGLSAGDVPPRTRSGALLRLRTWFGRPRLDAAIARGLHQPRDSRLALRESQLVEARQRRRLATRIEEVLATPTLPRAPSSTAPIDRRAVEIASPVLTDLILLLRSRQAVEARGVALGWRLLTDPGSPLYEPEERGSSGGRRLWRQALAVVQALRPARAVPA